MSRFEQNWLGLGRFRGTDAEAIKSLLSEQFLSKYEQGIVQVTVEPIKEIDEEGVWL